MGCSAVLQCKHCSLCEILPLCTVGTFSLYTSVINRDVCAIFRPVACDTSKYSGEQIKKNGIGRACGTNGRQERCVQGFGGET